jgi:hypothetical protein
VARPDTRRQALNQCAQSLSRLGAWSRLARILRAAKRPDLPHLPGPLAAWMDCLPGPLAAGMDCLPGPLAAWMDCLLISVSFECFEMVGNWKKSRDCSGERG